MATGTVFDIQRYSIHDGPGIRTTVFLKGCPLSCKWCHNPEGQSGEIELIFRENRCGKCGACLTVCKHGAISWDASGPDSSRGPDKPGMPVTDRTKCRRCGECTLVCFSEARELTGKEMSVDQVMSEVERDIPFYEESGGGITLSGGEPLMQGSFALELLKTSKARGTHTCLDTCGFAEWSTIDSVRQYVDLFLYDLKLIDDRKHQEFVGVSNRMITENLRALAQRGHNIVLRVPIIPGINEDDENIRQIGAFAAALPHLISVGILPYHHISIEKYNRLSRPYSLAGLGPPSDQRMTEIASILTGCGLAVKMGG